MKLVVDIGNTRVKWAFVAADRFVALGEAAHGAGPVPEALLQSAVVPSEVRIASVAGAEAGTRIAAVLGARFGVVPVIARSAVSGAGVRNGYTDPLQLGVDRWLAVCAAFKRHGAPVCVVDAGTATTIDLVTGDGAHLGGLILPGLHLMQSALWQSTSDLARLSGDTDGLASIASPVGRSDLARLPIALGRDTALAIRYGSEQATASLIQSCLDGFRGSLPSGSRPLEFLITGGAASALQAALERMAGVPGALPPPVLPEHRPHLVLEGLALDPPCFAVAS